MLSNKQNPQVDVNASASDEAAFLLQSDSNNKSPIVHNRSNIASNSSFFYKNYNVSEEQEYKIGKVGHAMYAITLGIGLIVTSSILMSHKSTRARGIYLLSMGAGSMMFMALLIACLVKGNKQTHEKQETSLPDTPVSTV